MPSCVPSAQPRAHAHDNLSRLPLQQLRDQGLRICIIRRRQEGHIRSRDEVLAILVVKMGNILDVAGDRNAKFVRDGE